MEKGTLGKTRKYKSGSVHENASGKFMILDRYLGDDGRAWLKYQWLNGTKEGQIEDNKEENINASMYKFRVSRGIKDIDDQDSEVIIPNQIFQLVEENNAILEGYAEDKEFLTNQILELQKQIINQNMVIEKILSMAEHFQTQINTLVQRNELVTKLVDKL
jgi:hypothetical protein